MVQVWMLHTQNGIESWEGNWTQRAMHRFPEIDKDGLLWLNDRPYVHDRSRDEPDVYRDTTMAKRGFMVGLLIALIAYLYMGETGAGIGLGIGLILVFVFRAHWKEDSIAHWRENEPDQMNILDKKLTPGSIGVTGDTVREFGKAEHIRQALNPGADWYMLAAIVLAIVGIIALIAGVAILYHA